MATQAQVSKMVELNVHDNVTSLILHLADSGSDYECEIRDVMSKENWIDPASDDDIQFIKDDEGIWFKAENEDRAGPYDTEEEAAQAACEHYGIEPYYDEAYEFYIVSDWLAHQLKMRGEMVEEILDLTIWGRCATGQVIWLDGIMIEIYNENEVN